MKRVLVLCLTLAGCGGITVEQPDEDTSAEVSNDTAQETTDNACQSDADCNTGLSCRVGTCNTSTGFCDVALAPNTCYILDACFDADAWETGNRCRICDPTLTPNDFVNKQCDGGQVCEPSTGDCVEPTPDVIDDAVPDATPDAVADATPDTGPDGVADATPDGTADATPDGTADADTDAADATDDADAAADAADDAVTDATADASPDAVADAVADTAADSVADVVPDAVADALPDGMADATPDATADAVPDGGGLTEPDPSAVAQFESIASLNPGPLDGVAVTYIKPQFSTDWASFFLQASPDGPALSVSVAPTDTFPDIEVGDIINIDITSVILFQGRVVADAYESLEVVGGGYDVTQLTQDITDSTDLTSALSSYENELIAATFPVMPGTEVFAGTGHTRWQVELPNLPGDINTVFRIPLQVRDEVGELDSCVVSIADTPLWRFQDQAQLSAWNVGEMTVTGCPDVQVLDAIATAPDKVLVTFNRGIDAGSLDPTGSQFSIVEGLTVTGATLVSGTQVEVTTGIQTAGADYTVVVADTLTDISGSAVDFLFAEGYFLGYVQPAAVVFNEINANVANPNCDLIELRVTESGSLSGFTLFERTTQVHTFTLTSVAKNDIILVLFGLGCPSPITPATTIVAIDDSGLTATTNTLTLRNSLGQIEDAVLLADQPTSTSAAGASENAAADAAAAGEWEMVGGGVPPTGFIDADFVAHAVAEMTNCSTDPFLAASQSIIRISDTDTNTKADWGLGPASFGTVNQGQAVLP